MSEKQDGAVRLAHQSPGNVAEKLPMHRFLLERAGH